MVLFSTMLIKQGANTYGQLSQGFLSELHLHPTDVASQLPVEGVVGLTAGGGHTLVLSSDGGLMGAGSNSFGQLGNCKDKTSSFHKLDTLQEFRLRQIECGWDSSYAVTDRDSVVAWGSNKCGQLGIAKEKVVTTQQPVTLEISHIVQLSSGLRHTAVVTSAGHVYVCGRGNKGQLGVLTPEGKVPTKDMDSLIRVEGLENVQQVACGQYHTLALTQDGRLFGWGDNKRGQLGEGGECFPQPHLITNLDSDGAVVRAGWTHSALLVGGKVRTWGRNNYSQLGHSCGQEHVNNPHQLVDLDSVKQLELGSEHNMALLENGQVWSWGWNEHGSCGTGTVENVSSPRCLHLPYPASLVACGGGHSMALITS